MTPQHCNSVAPSPNMLPPELAGTSDIDAGDPQILFSNMEPTYHSPYDMLDLQSYALDFTPSLPKSHMNLSLQHLEPLRSPAAFSDISGLSSSNTESGLSIHRNNMQTVDQTALPWPLPDTESAGGTTPVAPVSSKSSGVKASRLPSDKIPRKAPLKTGCGTPDTSRQDTGRKIPKPRQQRSTSRQETSMDATVSVKKRRRNANDKRQSSEMWSRPALQEAREDEIEIKREVIQANDDYKETEKTMEDAQNHEENANNTDVDTNEHRQFRRKDSFKAARSQATKLKKSVKLDLLPSSRSSCRRRPVYNYEVPLELEGARKALGSDDWNEYVFLMESLWLHKVSAHEFDQGAKRIFHMYGNGLRKKMNTIMLMKMIVPQLEEMHGGAVSME